MIRLLRKYDAEIRSVSEFKKALIEYFRAGSGGLSSEERECLRERLNMSSGEVATYVATAGVPTTIDIRPKHAPAGGTLRVDVFTNLFRLWDLDPTIGHEDVADILDRAIGNYIFLRRTFYEKVFNPFYWAGEVIRIPFYLASFAGFDSTKMELSLLGKLYKFAASFAAFIWALIQMLSYFGLNVAKLVGS